MSPPGKRKLLRRLWALLIAMLLAPIPASAEDWTGFYAGIFGGASQIEGQHPRWPTSPLLGFVDGNIPLYGPTGFGAGIDYTTFSVPHGNLAEIGGLIGYSHRIGDTPFLLGGEVSASISNPRDEGWGATQMITAELGGTYSRGTKEGWFSGGPSIEMILRGGWIVHDLAAVFVSAGVAVDQRGLALAYDRWGPGTLTWGTWEYTPIPGVSSTAQVRQSPAVHISPVVGIGTEVSILDGWRVRADYQAKWTAPQELTLDVVRSTSDPIAYPVSSDTATMTINGYLTHTFRLGLIKSFSP